MIAKQISVWTTLWYCKIWISWGLVPPRHSMKMLPKGAKESRKAVNKSVRAGVIFPVARIHRYLKKRSANKLRISAVAPVYKAAVLEYLTGQNMD